jgi:hypothetical protein
MDAPNFYAIIPASVRYDEKLMPNAKLLYGEISAMTSKEGYCWAENSYFAELYEVSIWTISRWISQLEKQGHIKTILNKIQGNKRKIFIEVSSFDLLTKNAIPITEKRKRVLTKSAIAIDGKRTSIYENNTMNNTMNRERKALAFFEVNSPSEWENFQMRFRKKFSETEWEKFKELFECKIDEEGLEFTTKIISARLKRFAINYCENLDKDKNKFGKPIIELKPAYMLKPLT